jgi:hypothetical protein
MIQHMRQLQETVLQDCQQFIKTKETTSLKENNMFWKKYFEERQEHNPFSPTNLETTIFRVPS